MAERTGLRGLGLVLLALLLLLAAFDLLRRDSWLRSLGSDDGSTPMERVIRGVRDDLPRSRPR